MLDSSISDNTTKKKKKEDLVLAAAPISIVSIPSIIDLDELDQSLMYSRLHEEIILKTKYD